MKHRIAFNRMALSGKLPQGDPRWLAFNESFDNLTLTSVAIADHIQQGYAFTTWMDGRRSLDSFICGQHIAVDMDTNDDRSTLASLSKHLIVRMYGAIIYTTPSHTPETPRARVIFLLDQIITDARAYQEAAKFLISQFAGADVACSDASRFFYGSMKCEIAFPDNVLPVLELRNLYRRWLRTQPKPKPAPVVRGTSDGVRQLEKMAAEMAATAEGSRNHTLNRLAFIAGRIVNEGAVTATVATDALKSAATKAGLPATEAEKTILRAIEKGKSH